MSKKYELLTTSDMVEVHGVPLHRIRRLRDGELGGWIQSEDNLSQLDTCWVGGNARVFGNTWIFGKARIDEDAWVYGEARVSGNAQVSGNAWVSGNVQIYGDAQVYGNARVSGKAQVSGNSIVTRSVLTANPGIHTITVTDNNVQVGCEVHSHDYWLSNYREIGERNEYTEEWQELYGGIIRLVVTAMRMAEGEQINVIS